MSIESKERKLTSDDTCIAKVLNCSPFIAAKTKQATTQKGVRFIVADLLSRHHYNKQATLKYPQLGIRHGTFNSDTLFSTVMTTRGNKCAHIFANDISFDFQ